MHGDVAGVAITVVLIAVCWMLSRMVNDSEVRRKILHIGVSNFGLIYYFVFYGDLYAALGLAAFAVLNLIVVIRSRSERLGTVIFPISILIMMLLENLGFGSRLSVACATLCMGWGDGLACLFGRKFGRTRMPFSKSKTVVGFATLSVVVFLVIAAMYGLSGNGSHQGRVCIFAVACSLIGGLAESYTPWGMDNLSFPLVVYCLCSLI